jgi:hypothetical protein
MVYMSDNEAERVGWAAALAAVREAYGGDPADPAWRTPEGIAGIIEELSGLGRALAASRAFALMERDQAITELHPTSQQGLR